MLRNRLGEEIEDQFAAACHRATGGNPLFLRELVAALVDAEIAPTAEAAGSVTTVGPPAVGRFVLHRLERLGPSATELARSVAVLGGSLHSRWRPARPGSSRAEARRVADLLVRAESSHRRRVSASPTRSWKLRSTRSSCPAIAPPATWPPRSCWRKPARPSSAPPHTCSRAVPPAMGGRSAILRAAASSAAERGAPAASVAYLRRALEEPPAIPSAGPFSASSAASRSPRTKRSATTICKRRSPRRATRPSSGGRDLAQPRRPDLRPAGMGGHHAPSDR